MNPRFAVRLFLLRVLVCVAVTMTGPCARAFIARVWQSEEGLPGSTMRALDQAADGSIWVATAEGVARFNGHEFIPVAAAKDVGRYQIAPRGIVAMQDGAVWLATVRGGLLKSEGNVLRRVLPDVDRAGQVILQPTMDGGVSLWQGETAWYVAAGASPVRDVVPVSRELAPHGRARLLAPFEVEMTDREGRVWRGSAKGVSLDGKNLECPDIEHRFQDIIEDREGNIWLATADTGLVQYRVRRVRSLTRAEGLSDNSVRALMQTRDGTWWIAPRSGGLDRMRAGKIENVPVNFGSGNQHVIALCEDADGQIWASLHNGSLVRQSGGEFIPALPPETDMGRVQAMVCDADGRMWLGTMRGLYFSHQGKITGPNEVPTFPKTTVTALALSRAGGVVAGLENGRVFKVEVEGGAPLSGEIAGQQRAVLSVTEDAAGRIWVGTYGDGLLRWRDGKWQAYRNAEGLPDARLTAVLADERYLWLGTLRGVYRASLESFEMNKPDWLLLDRSDGLGSHECVGNVQPSIWRGQDGEIWLPTIKGVAEIIPDKISLNKVPPKVVIESVVANGTRMPLGDIVAGPGPVRIEIGYAAMSFVAPERNRYRVRMIGRNDEWSPPRVAADMVYGGLLTGEYTFEVIAANNDGIWNEQPTTFKVTILPYVWEQTWFRLFALGLLTLFAGSVGAIIVRKRATRHLEGIRIRHAREQERARIARDLHDDLGASLTEISLLATLGTEESNGTAQAFGDIAARARSAATALDEIVWAVNPRHDTLDSLAGYISAAADEFLRSAGINLRLDFPPEIPSTIIEAECRHALLLAAREALNNTVKHAGAGEVHIALNYNHAEVTLTISDDGGGFDVASAPQGEGQRNLRTRLAVIGGKTQVESKIGAGTRVTLMAPFQPRTKSAPSIP